MKKIFSFIGSPLKKNSNTRTLTEMMLDELEKMDETIDQIRKRYGNDSVIRAAFLGGCIDHMSGGISREKRSVDYEKLKTE